MSDIEKWLQKNTFNCAYLRAKLTKQACVDRQRDMQMTIYYGRKIILNNDPQSQYCRSGDCKTGNKHLVQLGFSKRRLREREALRRRKR